MNKSHAGAALAGALLMLAGQQALHVASAVTSARDVIMIQADGSTEIVVARSGTKTKERVFPVVLKQRVAEATIKLANGKRIDAAGLKEAGAAVQKLADAIVEKARSEGAFEL